MFQTIEIEIQNRVATLWLNRPEVRNAFNGTMILEIYQGFQELSRINDLRLVVIRGRGNAFCSGADLNWMREVKEYSLEKNMEDGLALGKCLAEIYYFPKPVVVVAHGAVIGGGIGLVSAADISLASNDATFLFSEVTIGLVPAVISPFVIKRVGLSKSKELMMLGDRFSGEDAFRFGLINRVADSQDLEVCLQQTISKLLKNSPASLIKTKELLNHIETFSEEDSVTRYTARILAHTRRSEDGQEGMNAFLEKRTPNWK